MIVLTINDTTVCTKFLLYVRIQPVLQIPPTLTEVGGWVFKIQRHKEEEVRASTPMYL